jgi:hypothetical protein
MRSAKWTLKALKAEEPEASPAATILAPDKAQPLQIYEAFDMSDVL